VKKWILIVVAVIALAAVLVQIAGSLVPRQHVASCRASFAQPPEAIWAAIAAVEEYPQWRSDVRSVEPLAAIDGKRVYREVTSFGPITFVVDNEERPRRMVLRIADDDLPFGGTWTFELEPEAAGSRLTITERGEIRPAYFRFMARFVFGYHATLREYLRSLGSKFGQSVTPAEVERD
jgi:uncharacterized protein YndB with AHSA1/START domain